MRDLASHVGRHAYPIQLCGLECKGVSSDNRGSSELALFRRVAGYGDPDRDLSLSLIFDTVAGEN